MQHGMMAQLLCCRSTAHSFMGVDAVSWRVCAVRPFLVYRDPSAHRLNIAVKRGVQTLPAHSQRTRAMMLPLAADMRRRVQLG